MGTEHTPPNFLPTFTRYDEGFLTRACIFNNLVETNFLARGFHQGFPIQESNKTQMA